MIARAFGHDMQLCCNAVESQRHAGPRQPAPNEIRKRVELAAARAALTLPFVTLEEMVAAYAAHHAYGHDRSTKKQYRRTLTRLAELGGPWAIEHVDVVAAQLLYDEALRRWPGRGSSSFANVLKKCVRSAWTHAAQRGKAPPTNPWKLVKSVPVARRNLYFETQWLPKAMDVVEQAGESGAIPPHAARFLAVYLSCAARPWKDLLELKVRNVDVAAGVIIFESKMKRIRSIPMDVLEPRARAALLAQLEIAGDGEWVWPPLSTGPHMSKKPIQRAWRLLLPLFKQAGIRITTLDGDPMTAYVVRAAWASYVIGVLGRSREEVAQILGHKDTRTLDHYLFLSIDYAVPAARAFAQAIAEFSEAGEGGCNGDDGDEPDDARDPGDGGGGDRRYGCRGDRIRRAREDLGLTQQQLGDELGVTKAAVSDWERNRTQPTTPMIDRLHFATGKSHGFFFGVGAR